ncbi:predicted protein [Nematostella vectensis]|uniref:ATP-dependent DNA helicase n=1 Tax=Nematostella vectensis TaxID=45351 RepID=A7T2L4_NEMVE|nr:predicted protein [Nematostella vectensis]|eukprot:XP_001621903.1 hypothetical protein NEMVEDRAFT_v1g221440 [Nematostella vectensis]
MASDGHNFAIFVEAGTGKSMVVSEVCKSKDRHVQVVCSTGIACEVYDKNKLANPPTTVQSFPGIGTAKAPFHKVVDKSVKDEDLRRRLIATEWVIWDECSMSSARMLLLFHERTRKVRGSNLPFGGIQDIVVGDWLKLQPVKSKFNDGTPMFKHGLFERSERASGATDSQPHYGANVFIQDLYYAVD